MVIWYRLESGRPLKRQVGATQKTETIFTRAGKQTAQPEPGKLLSSHFHCSRTSGVAAPICIASLQPGLVAWTAGVALVLS